MASVNQRVDNYEGHDYYNLDELLNEDHLLARQVYPQNMAEVEWMK